jgi:site-specific recombinase XerC
MARAAHRDARQPGGRGARAKRPKTLPKALSVDDASALMDAPLPDTTEGIRDHAILELFYSSGLRLAELVGLDAMYTQADGYRSAGWLDLAEAEVTVRGKGNKERRCRSAARRSPRLTHGSRCAANS